MNGRFEELWTSAANDGAHTPYVRLANDTDTADESEALMTAWYQERTERIEYSLLLEEAEVLIDRILAIGEIPPRTRRMARRFLRATRDTRDRKQERDDP